MEPRQIIGTGITASAIAHLSILALVILFSEVHRFGSVTAEPIAVELVSPDELKPSPSKEEPLTIPKIEPSDAFNLASQSKPADSPPPAAPPMVAAQPPQRPAPTASSPGRQQASAMPQPPSPQPAYTPPEPDLTVRYHVMLGLPIGLPADRPLGISPDDVEAPASIAPGPIKEFRRHLRTCSKLPAAVAPSDQFEIKVRVLMTPEGRLAAKPVGIEGPGNAKGPALIESAIAALQACQPYRMLPVERYSEWKVLDLSFTPRDFVGG
jgi:hypothetical protein